MVKTMPYLGVIEGFFGRMWSMQARQDYAAFLKNNGYHFYIYAPKGDPFLRRSWRQDWSPEEAGQLQSLIKHYQQLGLDFGVGLSPFEIYKNYDNAARQELLAKVERLNHLGVNILCILFDDMRGDQPDLAQTQINILQDVLAHSSVKRLIMCPTYYSFDSRLEKVFGAMPEGYFQELGEGLPAEVDIFWTGPEICSTEYTASHMQSVMNVLGRQPFLWDNYPVNDGATISKFLHLHAFENRPADLSEQTTGHSVNPMNQPWLSQIPLYSLPKSYEQAQSYDAKKVLEESLYALCEGSLAQQLNRDIEIFQSRGLDRIDKIESNKLVRKYSQFDSPYAKEVVDWLEGKYIFDKNCLTG